MLRKARTLLREGGFVAIVLPLATVDNSRYFNDETLRALMASLQFAERVVHRSLKLYFALYQLGGDAETGGAEFKRTLLRNGRRRNNFYIELLNA